MMRSRQGGGRSEQYDEIDAQVPDAVQHGWTEFARTGIPQSPDERPWPATAASTPWITSLGDTVRSLPVENGSVTRLIHSLRTAAAPASGDRA
ncbi:carboxylesterase family protein [Kribbella sp. VKM Ac-2568]|uniref:carboxylesterase family protein n=1 Tax=Kribbella sp. VKM Ac-2568 TaxID=2512219 RepID=UPI00130522C5|nr:carboxylesterase family protein [Kribbella sp. VKM Ac-2568]